MIVLTSECRYITSDCDAVATVFEYQGYVKSAEDAVADVLKAGIFVCSMVLLSSLHCSRFLYKLNGSQGFSIPQLIFRYGYQLWNLHASTYCIRR